MKVVIWGKNIFQTEETSFQHDVSFCREKNSIGEEAQKIFRTAAVGNRGWCHGGISMASLLMCFPLLAALRELRRVRGPGHMTERTSAQSQISTKSAAWAVGPSKKSMGESTRSSHGNEITINFISYLVAQQESGSFHYIQIFHPVV